MNYWENYLEPVKYTDDIWYIGAKNAPSWLIKSTEGIILIDTSMPQNLYQLIININKLGFDNEDIKHIIHSHGHIDHIGGTRALKELTGAKTYIGEGDVDIVKGVNQLQWTNEFNMKFEEPFEPDVVLKDADQITIGDKKFLFYSCPGHTAGTLSIFFNTTYNGKEYRAGMFGGAGLNSMREDYMEKYNLPASLREDFIKSLDRMSREKVDVHLGNHIQDCYHFEKLSLIKEIDNPFINPSSWNLFLDKKMAEAKAELK